MSGCAIGPDGQLLNASAIPWFNDSEDVVPIYTPPPALSGVATPTPNPSISSSQPVRNCIPASRLTKDNAELPALASHQKAICAQQAQTPTLPDCLSKDTSTKRNMS